MCPNARSLAWLLWMDEMFKLTELLWKIRGTMIQTGSVSESISWSPSYGHLHRSMIASTRLCKTSHICTWHEPVFGACSPPLRTIAVLFSRLEIKSGWDWRAASVVHCSASLNVKTLPSVRNCAERTIQSSIHSQRQPKTGLDIMSTMFRPRPSSAKKLLLVK